jgi:Fe2+ transport system protein FeoA
MLPRRATEAHPVAGDKLTLAAADRDTTVRVTRVAGRPRLIQRLAAIGVVPGVLLTIVKPHGPSIVSLGGARIAIGKSAAQSVEIEIAD